MALAYSAAEYFIGAICKNPTYSITYDFVKNVKNLICGVANQETVAYLNQEFSNDPLFIFKKFPDIFVLKKDCICLTEAFLSVCFLNSSYFSQFQNVNNYFDNAAVQYFRDILAQFGPQNLIYLFQLLMNDRAYRQVAAHFQHFNTIDAANFFLSHADIFIICNGLVHLNVRVPSNINPLMKTINDANALNKLRRSVYFLLTCFSSLHYIELKQCITYSVTEVRTFLNELSLVRQREIFENFPDAKMDKFGFLSLKYMNVDHDLPGQTKVILLITCILAFRKEVYIPKLIDEMSNRAPSLVGFLRSKPLAEQVMFFQKYTSYFILFPNFYVGLLPSFIFPVCSFGSSAKTKSKVTEVFDTSGTSNSIRPIVAQKNPPVSAEDAPVNNGKEKKNPNESVIKKYSLAIPGLSEDTNEKIRLSVFYLLACFKALETKRTLKTLLHVLDGVRISFCSLSESDKHNFIALCCKFIKITSFEKLTCDSVGLSSVTEKERVLLQVTYLLARKIKMSCSNLLMCLKKDSAISISPKSSEPEMLNYFFSMVPYVNIKDECDVLLSETFFPIKAMIDSYATVIDKHCRSEERDKSPIPQSGVKSKPIPDKESDDVFESQATNKESVVNALSADELPENVYKILDYSTYFLKKHFNTAKSKTILAVSIFALNDLKKYFLELSSNDQTIFVAKCHSFISKERDSSYTCILSEKEKTILFTVYLLSDKEHRHFQKIVSKLEEHRLNSVLRMLSVKLQFSFFKNDAANYFMIDGDGFVSLCPSYYHIASVIHLALSSKSFQFNKLQISVPNSSSNVPSQRTVRRSVTRSESSSSVLSVDCDTQDLLIDVCVFILSLCEKMSVEKLCCRLNACNSEKIQNLFPFSTITDKLNFFKNLPEYFNVSKDGFVTLNEATSETYVRKTSVNLRGLFGTSRSASRESFGSSHTRSGSARSIDISELSEPVSPHPGKTTRRRTRSRGKKRQSARSTSLAKLPGISTVSATFTNPSTSARENDESRRSSLGINDASGGRKMCMAAIKAAFKSNTNSCDGLRKDAVDKLNNNDKAKSTTLQLPAVKTEEKSKVHSECDNLQNSISALIDKTKCLSLNQAPSETKKESVTNRVTPILATVSSERTGEKSTKNSNASILKNFRAPKVPRQPSAEESETTQLSSNCASAVGDISKGDASYEAYITELIDSCLNRMGSPVSKTSSSEHGYSQKDVPNLLNLANAKESSQTQLPETRSTYQFSACAVPEETFENSSESKAVNFFCMLLRYYEVYEKSVSVDFLKKHIGGALPEVQSFMCEHYKYDFLPFFQKHKKYFYVASQARNVYLLKKFPKFT